MELVWTPLAELVRRIATKDLSPVELTRAFLERIAAHDRGLRCFLTVTAERALEAAAAAEAAVMAGGPLGPLHGLPFGAKDLYQTRGIPTTAGSRILAGHVPDEDATVVRRLTEAGAILLGKLNLHEFAYGPEGLNDHHGHARNPWDPSTERIAGGSSSGSAVATATALCPATLGSDTGGSIRIPAALCAITGIKPTYGRVSRAGVIPLAWSLDHAGPMARTAADCALLLGPMSGYDPADPASSVLPVPDYAAALTGELNGLRVGLLRGVFADGLDPAVRAAVDGAARTLERAGAIIDEVVLAGTEALLTPAALAIVSCEALAYHAEWLRTRSEDYQPDVRDRLRLGAFVTGLQYVRAQQVRSRVRAEVNEVLARRDVLLAATTPIAAPAVGEREVVVEGRPTDVRAALIRFTRPFNLSGHPACSVPCGFTPDGRPIGMQLVGRLFDEATVLRAADGYQRLTDWHTRRPPLAP